MTINCSWGEFSLIKENTPRAEAYYESVGNKEMAGAERYLHPDVQLIGPLAEMTGKEAVLKAVKGFLTIFKSLTIRAKFGSGDQVMIAYDLDCPAPVGNFRAAVLLTFRDDLIARLELFYDGRPFEEKKEEIFSS